MTSQCNEAQIEVTSKAHSVGGSNGHGVQALSNEALDGVLRALEIPFDANLVQWRITEWSDDGTRGLMMPYADPRAYSDRLNSLFTPAGWTRKYSVQASAPVQRSKRGPAAKILVTCEATLTCIGTNSGTGEEWSDKENALTGAEAQAFKRALSCFGLGRYLYDLDGQWIELDREGVPKKIPKLPRWATPKGWLAGLRPKPRRNRHRLGGANGQRGSRDFRSHGVNGHGQCRTNWNGSRLVVTDQIQMIGHAFSSGFTLIPLLLAQLEKAIRNAQVPLSPAQRRLTRHRPR